MSEKQVRFEPRSTFQERLSKATKILDHAHDPELNSIHLIVNRDDVPTKSSLKTGRRLSVFQKEIEDSSDEHESTQQLVPQEAKTSKLSNNLENNARNNELKNHARDNHMRQNNELKNHARNNLVDNQMRQNYGLENNVRENQRRLDHPVSERKMMGVKTETQELSESGKTDELIIWANLKKLHNYLFATFISFFVNNAIFVWSMYEVRGSTGILIPVVLHLIFFGIFALLLLIYQKLLTFVYSCRRPQKYHGLSKKFIHVIYVCFSYILVNIITTYQTLITIILKLSTSWPSGLMAAFKYLPESSQAIFVILIINFIINLYLCATVSFYSHHMSIYYLKKSLSKVEDSRIIWYED